MGSGLSGKSGDHRPAPTSPVPSRARSIWTEDASAEQGQLGPPVAGSFDQLDSGDVALDRPGAPGIAKRVGDRLQVVGHTCSQTCEGLEVARRSVKQPLLERCHVEVMQRGAETLDELVARIE